MDGSEIVIFGFCLIGLEWFELLEFVFGFMLNIDFVYLVYGGLFIDIFVCGEFVVYLKCKLIIIK